MMKRYFSIMILLVCSVAVMAVPAKKGIIKTLVLGDGTEVKATLVGDEFGHFWRGFDGKAYSLNGDVYEEIDAKNTIEKARVRRSQVNASRFKRLAARRAFGEPTYYVGKKKAIIILVNFKDVKFGSSHNNSLYQRIANEEGFSEGKFKGSMSDYFKAQSRGQFELDFDVVGPVTVSKNMSYYGTNDNEGVDKFAGQMVCEAVELAKSQISDWTQYDWDVDGYVDQVYCIYAGYGAADTKGKENTIWPHAYTLSEAAYYGDGSGAVTVATNLVVNSYACGPELNGGTGGVDGIGTMCHEFSHCLGYPDFYDTDYSGGQGMQYWDLMDSGSYNDDGYQPAGYTSYERWFAGWLKPIELSTEDVTVDNLKSMQNGGESYIIYNKSNSNEYYLIENRQQDGWDTSLPSAGLMITHVDYDYDAWIKNTPNDDPNHQRCTVVPADGKYTRKYDANYGYYYEYEDIKRDLFPYGSVNSFNKNFKTSDGIAKKAAQWFKKDTNGTYWFDGSIENITRNADGTVSFKYVAKINNGGQGGENIGDGEFEKVTSDDQLVAGWNYVLVNESNAKGNGSFDFKYFTAIDVVVSGNTVSGDDLVSMVLGGNANGYSFSVDGQYLTTSEPKKLSFTNSESTIWLIESTADGYVVTTDGFGTIQYNSASNANRFMNYTSIQKPAVLYVKKGATAIQVVDNDAVKSNRIYTLDGRYVGTDLNALSRGIYILNGKKVMK